MSPVPPPVAPPAPAVPHFLASHRRVPRVGTALLNALDRVDAVFDRLAGSRYNPLYQTGPLAVVALAILAVTGVYLFIFYSVGHPYESMARIQDQAFFGRWIRALHRYAADAALLFTVVHALRLFLQGRTWGARSLAWISGVIMTVLLLACGWTGFVLVWDVFGFQLALEGARLFDMLPFFPEPIQGQFVSEKSLGSMFFFVNLFAHVGIPLGLLLVLWIHVSRTARTTLFPPRALLIAVTGGLTALSIVWPIALDARASLDQQPSHFIIDWLYAFWLALSLDHSPWPAAIFWAVSGTALLSAPWWWRPARGERPQASTVNERGCEGCRQCYLDCPYDAIQMIPRTLGTGSAEVARVTPDLCVSCGICAGSCDVFRVGPPGRGGRDQLLSLRGLLEEKRPAPEELVMFCCTQSATRMRAVVLPEVTVIPMECAGNVHATTIASALKRGALGVIIWSCPPRNCQFREGPTWLRARLEDGREAALPKHVDRSRVLLLDAGPGEVRDALVEIDRFRARLTGRNEPALVTRSPVPGRVVAAASLLVGLGLLGMTTFTRALPTAALRLAWRHDSGLIEHCRVPLEAEQAALPPHMRQPKICERRYPDFRLVVRIDGATALDRIVEAGGARKDRAPQMLFDVPVPEGRHAIAVDFEAVLSAAELQDASERRLAPLTLAVTIDAEPGSIWRIDWERETHALRLIAPQPAQR